MFVEFGELSKRPREVVTEVMKFIDVDPTKVELSNLPLSKGTSLNRRGRRMHPAVRRKLHHYFAVPNQQLFALVGREFPWQDGSKEFDEEEGYGGLAASLPVQRASSTRHLIPESSFLPGRSTTVTRKDSTLTKRSFSVNASTN